MIIEITLTLSQKNSQQIIMAGKRSLPALEGPVSVKAIYYLATARVPDLVNLMGATADILEGAGVIMDDKQILSWDGSRIVGKDPEPRVEIFIEQFEK